MFCQANEEAPDEENRARPGTAYPRGRTVRGRPTVLIEWPEPDSREGAPMKTDRLQFLFTSLLAAGSAAWAEGRDEGAANVRRADPVIASW